MTQEGPNTASDDGGGRVAVADPELVEDPDRGLELREDFSTELQTSLAAMDRGDTTISPVERVAERLRLSW